MYSISSVPLFPSAVAKMSAPPRGMIKYGFVNVFALRVVDVIMRFPSETSTLMSYPRGRYFGETTRSPLSMCVVVNCANDKTTDKKLALLDEVVNTSTTEADGEVNVVVCFISLSPITSPVLLPSRIVICEFP